MNIPKVSVIVPNYCHYAYLDERLHSIFNQTFQDYEVIILDDCSPDNGKSKAVIESYRSNPKVSHIVYNETNSGSTFKQWKKGIELAKGELIWIAESDDSCDNRLLDSLVSEFLDDPNKALAFTYSQFINQNGEKIDQILPISDKVTRISGKAFVSRYMTTGNVVKNASSALFKKSIATQIDDVYMNYTGGGDKLFWILIAYMGNVSIIHAPYNLFRRHEGVVTDKKSKDGTNFKEAWLTYQYMNQHHLISPIRAKLTKWRYQKMIKDYTFYNSHIKDELNHIWGTIDNPLLILLVRVLGVLKNKAGLYL